MKVSIAIGDVDKEFLESLKKAPEKAVAVTIDELSKSCEDAFELYAAPLKEHLESREQQKKEKKMNEKISEGISAGASLVVSLMEKNQKRRDGLVEMLIPQLAPEAKRKIIDDYEGVDFLESDDDKLRHHLEVLIEDFDANLHWLEESEISALAGIINQKPLVSFSSPD